ncbi:competence/damage-inducible protein A [Novipirellula artificiosorum]|uniref:Putative competence-damage inducible protein n=1 Tax=Novipirellula artificiosorum TaxID=2528016 RepID=A0A5C6DUY6_9BACT|nr:molybdopterin-binding protein [Novipirellula artificiosorum]TWU40462.1 putative competence-damage inducible protein [Novipirellula artificiosorum]
MTETNHRKPTAEVISIGDEMTSGARLDTNAQWLSRRLAELGVEVLFHTTVCDSMDCNVDVFRTAVRRVDVVVCTGGLGPTRDDLTRDALAEASGKVLEFRQQAMDKIERLFATRQRPMSQRNRLQAMFPKGSTTIPNPQGTAPGIDQTFDQGDETTCRVFALPGVPAEMKPMFDQTVAPAIAMMTGGGSVIRSLVMKFFGTGESAMEERLGEMISRDRIPRVGITVSAATLSLRITASSDSALRCDQMIAETRDEIMSRVGDLYFGEGEDFEQYHAIDQLLRGRKESLVVVELGYAAPLGDWFATLGVTPTYRGGISLATSGQLMRLTSAASFDASLDEIKSRFDADWLLLVDPYPAIEEADRSGMPTADVSIVVVDPTGQRHTTSTHIGGHPEILQPRIAKSAMAWLRTWL